MVDDTLHQTVLSHNPSWGIHHAVKAWCYTLMSIQETRRARLREVIGTGSIAAFAARMGKSPTQLSDMLAGRKSFGEKVARDIERRARLPARTLDEQSPQRDTAHVALDSDLLRQAVAEAEQRIAARGLTAIITPEDRAEVVLAVYEGLQEGMGIERVGRFVDGTLRAIARGAKVS